MCLACAFASLLDCDSQDHKEMSTCRSVVVKGVFQNLGHCIDGILGQFSEKNVEVHNDTEEHFNKTKGIH